LLARTAHAYTATGRIADAIEHYREAVAIDSTFANLAATDLLKFARAAMQGDDGLQASEAVAAAMVLKPGVSLDGIALPLARHLVRTGRYTRALPFFEQAASETDNSPEVLYELALAYDEAGQCASALALFERAWRRLSVAQRADADWRTGTCSIRLGAEALAEGDLDRALAYFQATVQLGEPRGQVPEAWFRLGEIFVLKEDCAAALGAFEQVLEADPSPNLRQRAEDQIERLRFERGSFGAC
jgi:tetratricopeptide (TPR) repeat protein